MVDAHRSIPLRFFPSEDVSALTSSLMRGGVGLPSVSRGGLMVWIFVYRSTNCSNSSRSTVIATWVVITWFGTEPWPRPRPRPCPGRTGEVG